MHLRRILVLVAAAAVSMGVLVAQQGRHAIQQQSATSAAEVVHAASLPLYFVKNEGQVDGSAIYYAEGTPTDLYFDTTGIAVSQTQGTGKDEQHSRATFRINFVGANAATPEAVGDEGPPFSYFVGQKEDWHTDISSTTKLRYSNLWQGIDLELEGRDGNLKYTFAVAPGADTAQIKLAYDGADVVVNSSGELAITTPLATIIDQAPVAEQESSSVEVAYDLNQQTAQVGFSLGDYDRSKPLIIDPIIISWANLIGGLSYDSAQGIASDSTGVYAGGYACGAITSFVPPPAGYEQDFQSSCDGYLYKLALDGESVIYATYLGGSTGSEGIEGLAIDSSGGAYVVSGTDSTDFPTTAGDANGIGSSDAAVSKISSAGTALTYSWYVGGSAADYGMGIAVDTSNRAYITGWTSSTAGTFTPPVAGGPDLIANGGVDNFVGRLNAAGSSFDYLGFIGGSGTEGNSVGTDDTDVIADSSGNAYVTSRTTSTQTTFPDGDDDLNDTMPVGGFDQVHGGSTDAYVAMISNAGLFSAVTYLGGSLADVEGGLVLANGSLYVGGTAASTQTTFPVVTGPDLTHNGSNDGFLTRLNTGLTTRTSNGFFGGTGGDSINSVDADANGDIYIAGITDSTQASFPLKDGPDLTYNGNPRDGFVAKIDKDDLSTAFSGYIGGNIEDWIYDIDVLAPNDVYAAFDTPSTNATLPNGNGFYSIGGFDHTNEGGYDGMIVHLTEVPAGVTFAEAGGNTAITEGGATDTYTIVLDSLPTSNVTVNITPNGEQTTNVGSRVFTPLNWDVPQSVTVTAVNDADVECIHPGSIAHSVTSSDLNYSGLAVDSVRPQITDNEPCTAGVTIAESGGSTNVVEGGATDTYTVVLDFVAYENVTIVPSPNSQVTVSPTVLTFGTTNWDDPQTVTVTAVNDGVPECAHDGLITHAGTGPDANYDGISIASVVPHITDINCGGQAVVVSESGGSTRVSEDGPTSDTYTVVLTTQPTADVAVAIGGSPATTTSTSQLVFTPSNWNAPQTVTVTAVPDNDVQCERTFVLGQTASSSDTAYNGIAVSSVAVTVEDLCERLEGGSVSALSVAVSRQRFPSDDSAKAAFIARDDVMADGFTGGPLAALLQGPLLLTPSTTLDDGVAAELLRVLPSHDTPVYVLGGFDAISADVYDELRVAGLTNLLQLGGATRRETAARIALHTIEKQGGVNRVFLAEDRLFVDALGAGSAAGVLGTDGKVDPILLSKRGSPVLDVFAGTVLATRDDISSVELVGGTTALPSSLETIISKTFDHVSSVERTGGDDRFATSVLLAKRFFGAPSGIVLANGSPAATVSELFAPLLASTLGADRAFPMLITRPDALPALVADYINENAGGIGSLLVVGDAGQVSSAIFDQLTSAL